MSANNRLARKPFKIFLGLFIALQSFFTISVLGAEIEIPSSFNPVGSGARAIGMGGAFIAVADDATAASWNPGGLIQLMLPEFSVVTSGFHRGEDIDFGTNPEGAGSHSVSELDINYFSAAYPFNLFNRNMVVSLSYQHLYDFNREWQFILSQNAGREISDDHWDYQQTGSLSVLGLSYCIQIIPEISLGITLNFWKDILADNKWEQKYHMESSGTLGNAPLVKELDKTHIYSFSGFNANMGLLWRINYKLTLGGVLKTAFTADVEYQFQKNSIMTLPVFQTNLQNYTRDEEIKMPLSYGIGIAYKYSDTFFISGDVYRTEWDDFIYKDAKGKETSPVSGRDINKSDVSPTHQIRAGFEYRFINNKKNYVIPLRGGIFYDPAPSEGYPDDLYGFSIGSGFTMNDRFSVDIAYQHRFGNNAGSILEDLNFSEDVDEHMVYLSVIYYKY
ncbi:MAG: hypothetical protein GY795_34495 [Desulfobacterales bacterium]|nr:hypothetical protein [Desulfobacterales bacterium]